MIQFVNILYLLASPFVLPSVAYKIMMKKKYRNSLKGMLGKQLDLTPSPRYNGGERIWVHAVSVGEVVAAAALIPELKRTFPDARVIASTITETGQQKAQKSLTMADTITYYPLDASWIVRKFLDHFRPTLFIMMETELWPNFLMLARDRGVRIFLANGKLSPRSFRLYKRFKFLFKRPLDGVQAFLMQTTADAERMATLCGSRDRVFVTGNCKFDSPGAPLSPEARQTILHQWTIAPTDPIIVAGSTHPGEEELILSAFCTLKSRFPSLHLVLAPRHPERFDEAYRLATAKGLSVSRASKPAATNPDVLLLDVMGELANVYGVGSLAIVGGSFVPIGGHNLLEAAIHRIPVLYGPHMHNQPEITEIMNQTGGGLQITANALVPTITELLENETRRHEIGQQAVQAVERNKGSARRSAEIIKNILDRAPTMTGAAC